jgi:hypothetical protein
MGTVLLSTETLVLNTEVGLHLQSYRDTLTPGVYVSYTYLFMSLVVTYY